MAKATTQETIEMLKLDMSHEHQAIIQYLKHAYAMGEGEIPAEIEAITRDEMYHWHWLAELVVELGGTPTIERAPLNLGGGNPSESMAINVQTEQEAIDLYYAHIAAIQDPKIERVLRRIIVDEESHKGDFAKMSQKLQQQGSGAVDWRLEAPVGQDVDRTVAILNQGVRHEYTVILQYLYHSATTPHCNIAEELHWQAVNEMQHMGWLSEEVHGAGAVPDTEHGPVDASSNTADMLRADISAERSVTMDYQAQMPELQGPGLKALFQRITDHEIYHDQLFSDMLNEIETGEQALLPSAHEDVAPSDGRAQPASNIRTPGSLFGEKQ